MTLPARVPGRDREFRDAVERLRVPGMGTEAVAPLLANLVHLLRPRRVLEVGMGYTTPFLARALSEVEELIAEEAAGLARKTAPYVREGSALDDAWVDAEPALLVPSSYREPYQPRLVAVDDLSMPDSSAGRVSEVLGAFGLEDLVTIVNADLRSCVPLLPADLVPVDLAWVDAWDCLYFFEECWDLVNPDGGVVALHYLMTYPEGEAVLDYIAESGRLRPGEFEFLNLLEDHKLRQNSLTLLRRTSGCTPRRYSDVGLRPLLDGPVREDAYFLAQTLNEAEDNHG
ncbi:hypothetical protein [Streptomyces sp. NPDC059788]|uniref:hypothetical protein n=1 Tax=Streptomyces sp. NPDC059788 TaxID=3346948 RepID=UPI0036637806